MNRSVESIHEVCIVIDGVVDDIADDGADVVTVVVVSSSSVVGVVLHVGNDCVLVEQRVESITALSLSWNKSIPDPAPPDMTAPRNGFVLNVDDEM